MVLLLCLSRQVAQLLMAHKKRDGTTIGRPVTGQTLHTPESFPRSAGQGSNSTQSTPGYLTGRGVFASSERMVSSSYTTSTQLSPNSERALVAYFWAEQRYGILCAWREIEARSSGDAGARRAGAKRTRSSARS